MNLEQSSKSTVWLMHPPHCGAFTMSKFFARFFLLALLVSLGGPIAKTQSTVTAASCNESDVNAVINGPTHTAVDGDIINIPAGTCTWTTELQVPKGIGIQIIGPGASSLTIIDAQTSGNVPILRFTPTYGNSLSRLSGITWVQSGASWSPIEFIGTCTSSGCPNARFDHNTVSDGWSGQADWIVRFDNMYGVVDHNTYNGSSSSTWVPLSVSHSSWLGVGQYGDNSWHSPDSLGTAAALYAEDNILNYVGLNDTDAGTNGVIPGGGRIVGRYNTYNNYNGSGAMYFHGTETGSRMRGGRQAEFYNNTVNCPAGCFVSGVEFRSGTGLVYNNTFTSGTGAISRFVDMSAYRAYSGEAPWGFCNGLGPYDDNDGTTYYSGTSSTKAVASGTVTITDGGSPGWTTSEWVASGDPYSLVDVTTTVYNQDGWSGFAGYDVTASTANSVASNLYGQDYQNTTPPQTGTGGPPILNSGDHYKILRASACADQPARSGGNLLSGTTPTTGWVGEALDPVYEFNDSFSGAALYYGPIASATPLRLIANRDFYNESVNQAAQTSATSPFNGTSGTGHGTLANRPLTCAAHVGYWATDANSGDGELYLCTSTNTWTADYTPYTYPHPLASGSTSSSNPAPPAGLSATVQ